MPEGPEVTILSQYLNTKLKNRIFDSIEILSGKYLRFDLKNANKVNNKKYKIKKIESKGKLMWMELDGHKYFMSHLGLAGFWSFKKSKNDRIRIKVLNEDNGKIYYLCYQDPRNFGNMEVIDGDEDFNKKINLLAPDALKTEFTDDEFIEWVKKYLSRSSSRGKQKIFLVLMKQNKSDGIVSGLGNYLTAEILYNAKISPYREISSLSLSDLKKLSESIKYMTKLSYYDNTTGYMTNFGDFIQVHKERIDKGKYPTYHKDIVLKKGDKFTFKVYQKLIDPQGHKVTADKELNDGRTTYWVEDVQK